MRTQRHVHTFTAVDDSSQEYVLHVYQEFNSSAAARDNPSGEVAGMKTLKTDDGRTVNRKSKGVYQIVGGEVLRSNAQDAP